jgi:hypothetical protein
MRATRLMESHRDPANRAFGFGIMNGSLPVVGSLGMPVATLLRRRADSRTKITR